MNHSKRMGFKRQTHHFGCDKMYPTSVVRFSLLALPLTWAPCRSTAMRGERKRTKLLVRLSIPGLGIFHGLMQLTFTQSYVSGISVPTSQRRQMRLPEVRKVTCPRSCHDKEPDTNVRVSDSKADTICITPPCSKASFYLSVELQ